MIWMYNQTHLSKNSGKILSLQNTEKQEKWKIKDILEWGKNNLIVARGILVNS